MRRRQPCIFKASTESTSNKGVPVLFLLRSYSRRPPWSTTLPTSSHYQCLDPCPAQQQHLKQAGVGVYVEERAWWDIQKSLVMEAGDELSEWHPEMLSTMAAYWVSERIES